MGRLILVPQYPTKLRYQEWWWDELPSKFLNDYDEVGVLGYLTGQTVVATPSNFSPFYEALEFEAKQCQEYGKMELREDDTLLLCDLSFTGLFANMLYHKRPKKCFAICHATSINRYDYFAENRTSKCKVESGHAMLFDKIFVGSNYHKQKLWRWPNVVVTGMPFPPFTGKISIKEYNIVSVARSNRQKRNARLEQWVEDRFECKIITPTVKTWDEYYEFLAKSKVLLITSQEETFGYQVLDAVKNNCIPIAPNRFSYPELISKDFLYNNKGELVVNIQDALYGGLSVPQLLIQDDFYENIIFEMQNE